MSSEFYKVRVVQHSLLTNDESTSSSTLKQNRAENETTHYVFVAPDL